MTTFNVTLRSKDDGRDSIRMLRAALKVLGRRFGLRAVRVEEQPASPKKRRAATSV
jgi:hypothetical protein